jgi:hypothetical protein
MVREWTDAVQPILVGAEMLPKMIAGHIEDGEPPLRASVKALIRVRNFLAAAKPDLVAFVRVMDVALDRLQDEIGRILIRRGLDPATPPDAVVRITTALQEWCNGGGWRNAADILDEEIGPYESPG